MRTSLYAARQPRGLTPNINVTPLVDVVLVLLIIFMVVIPNVQDGKSIEMLAVRDADEMDADADPVIVTIDRDETFSLGEDDMPRDSVLTAVHAMHRQSPGRPVLVRGDVGLRYHVVRDLFADLQTMGVTNVALAVGKARQWEQEAT
ncbi:MAG: biopolymer transporter ExbD [Nannocystaceae bacterium]|nr:biopolymer transporter ExbD [Nannocystaceae bacterium]